MNANSGVPQTEAIERAYQTLETLIAEEEAIEPRGNLAINSRKELEECRALRQRVQELQSGLNWAMNEIAEQVCKGCPEHRASFKNTPCPLDCKYAAAIRALQVSR